MTLNDHLKTGTSWGFSILSFNTVSHGVTDELALISTLGVVIGNVLPDIAEFKVIPHRTITHWLPFWWFLTAVATAVLQLQINEPLSYLIAGLNVGIFMHWLCDLPFYGGVPMLFPHKRVSMGGWSFSSKWNIFYTKLWVWPAWFVTIYYGYIITTSYRA